MLGWGKGAAMERSAIRRLHAIGMVLLTILMAGVVGGVLLIVQVMVKDGHRQSLEMLAQAEGQLIAHEISAHADLMAAVLAAMVRNDAVAAAFAARDRTRLLSVAAPLFETIRNSYRIDHLYFILPDETVFLRVHAPGVTGDGIGRASLARAAADGEVRSGVESGRFGSLMERTVMPWRDGDGTLIGYVELAIEAFDAVADTRDGLGGEVYLLMSKDGLDRAAWDESRRRLGIEAGWDSIGWAAVMGQTAPLDPAVAAEVARNGPGARIVDIDRGGHRVGLITMPLSGNPSPPAWVLAVKDLSVATARSERMMWIVGPLALAGGVLVILLAHVTLKHVEKVVMRTEAQRAAIEEVARRDGLTGALCRREFDRRLGDEIDRVVMAAKPLGLMMLDLDHFKVINDTHGHPVGDQVLRRVAAVVADNIRPTDHFARFGGEEFALIVPGGGPATLDMLAGRILDAVRLTRVPLEAGDEIGVTLSIGMACHDGTGPAADLLAAADRALYRAKESGRDRACAAA
ncbi:MAG: diguanylate cyclase [Magnetospirillum sp.]|nr:diguanylate cyclase [Magnetospirillum sp.]